MHRQPAVCALRRGMPAFDFQDAPGIECDGRFPIRLERGEIFPKQCAHCAPEPERNAWERWHLAGVLHSGELAGRMPALPVHGKADGKLLVPAAPLRPICLPFKSPGTGSP